MRIKKERKQKLYWPSHDVLLWKMCLIVYIDSVSKNFLTYWDPREFTTHILYFNKFLPNILKKNIKKNFIFYFKKI